MFSFPISNWPWHPVWIAMDHYRTDSCVPQDCSLVPGVLCWTLKRGFASRTRCWLKLVRNEFCLPEWITYWIILDAFESKYDAAQYQVTSWGKTAQTAAMLLISLFSFSNLEIIDYRASECPKQLRRHSLYISSSHSRSNKIYAPFFFPHKIHHQKLIARVKVLC